MSTVSEYQMIKYVYMYTHYNAFIIPLDVRGAATKHRSPVLSATISMSSKNVQMRAGSASTHTNDTRLAATRPHSFRCAPIN